jgi:hypothetical protein
VTVAGQLYPGRVDTLGIIRQLEGDAGLRAQLRAVLLGDEVLEMPALLRQLTERVDQLAGSVQRMVEAQERTFDELGRLKGFGLEFRLHLNPRRYVPRRLAPRRTALTGERLDALLDRVDPAVVDDVELADAFIEAFQADGERVVFVCEAAWSAHLHDVERAERRARALRQAGEPARPLVVSHVTPADSVVGAANSLGVVVVSEGGGLLGPSSPTAA